MITLKEESSANMNLYWSTMQQSQVTTLEHEGETTIATFITIGQRKRLPER